MAHVSPLKGVHSWRLQGLMRPAHCKACDHKLSSAGPGIGVSEGSGSEYYSQEYWERRQEIRQGWSGGMVEGRLRALRLWQELVLI